MKKKILIVVKTYPNPSKSYDETVCTAGIDEEKNWVRIYPINFRAKPLEQQYKKFHWVELDLKKTSGRDFRPESYHLADIEDEITILEQISSWDVRRDYVLNKVYYSYEQLLLDSQTPLNVSLAVYKPAEITGAKFAACSRDWESVDKEQFRQRSIFDKTIDKPLKKIPYIFRYDFVDDKGVKRSMQVLDWEIGALYWNCLESSGSEDSACKKVIEKLQQLSLKDMYFILGTTLDHHQRRLPNPFTIIGLFYPPFDDQLTIF